MKTKLKDRLEYLRGELRAERISMDELHELQSLAAVIPKDDVELLEAAGVPEFPATATKTLFCLESGERIQDALVQMTKVLGDCDMSADLAEIVNVLDRYENNDHKVLKHCLGSLADARMVRPGREAAKYRRMAHDYAKQEISKAEKGAA